MKQNQSMDATQRYQYLQPYLNPNEQLLWSGNPCATRKQKPNVLLVVFLLLWTGFAVYWTVSAMAEGGLFGLFGLLFVAVGLGVLCLAFIAPGKKYPRTVYAVTDTRVIFLIPSGTGHEVMSYPFRTMTGIHLSDVKGDSGSIVFSSGPLAFEYYEKYGNVHGLRSMTVPCDRFLLIDGVNEVYRLIMNQMETGA